MRDVRVDIDELCAQTERTLRRICSDEELRRLRVGTADRLRTDAADTDRTTRAAFEAVAELLEAQAGPPDLKPVR